MNDYFYTACLSGMSVFVFAFTWVLPAAAQQSEKTEVLTRSASPRENIVVTGRTRVSVTLRPAGQTTYSADRSDFASHTAQSVADMMATIPGVTSLQGNGPRDAVISVRGSGARQSYGLRNLQVMEDGFPMTQPDGTARADLIDPHAYKGVDVFQGPASTLYGNYAINGAINFRTRNGSDIHGVEIGSDFGSFNTFNNYITIGTGNKFYDFMFFGSNVRSSGFIPNSHYNTSTQNIKLRLNLTQSDRLILKFINNITDTALPLRLSLSQYRTNPYQKSCDNLATAECASVSLLVNGAYGERQETTPRQAGLGRFDRRTIVGLRWEHDFDQRTTWRTQFTYDQRHIDQPASSTSFVGPFNSYNVQTDLTNRVHVGGMPLTSFVGAGFDYMDYGYRVYNITPRGGAARGGLDSTSYGHQWNIGIRFQEDLHFAPHWHAVIGLGGTQSDVGAIETLYTTTEAFTSLRNVNANRHFFNLAPEASLIYTPSKDLSVHTRIGTAYGTPDFSSFFVTPQGTYGNNTQLKSQKSIGIDLGTKWNPMPGMTLQATGFYEFYRNELVRQSAGVNTPAGSYTFNAPASQHRGVELSATWQPWYSELPGARLNLSYTYDNQIYTKYTEALSNSTMSRSFSRKGNLIPGVIPHFLNARVLYDQAEGMFEGLGGFAEITWRSSFYIDNANIVKAPSYALLNLEIHYDPPKRMGWIHRLHSYFKVDNVTNQTYAAGATNISDTLLPNGKQAGRSLLSAKTGSIYAGTPRAFWGGVRVRF